MSDGTLPQRRRTGNRSESTARSANFTRSDEGYFEADQSRLRLVTQCVSEGRAPPPISATLADSQPRFKASVEQDAVGRSHSPQFGESQAQRIWEDLSGYLAFTGYFAFFGYFGFIGYPSFIGHVDISGRT